MTRSNSGLEFPERGGESDVVEKPLRRVNAPRRVRGCKSIAVPILRQAPHLGEADCFTARCLVVLRPKELDVASSEDDVVPPLAGGQWKADESLGAVESAVVDGEIDWFSRIRPGGLDVAVTVERREDGE